jgi:hypothetical protein
MAIKRRMVFSTTGLFIFFAVTNFELDVCPTGE